MSNMHRVFTDAVIANALEAGSELLPGGGLVTQREGFSPDSWHGRAVAARAVDVDRAVAAAFRVPQMLSPETLRKVGPVSADRASLVHPGAVAPSMILPPGRSEEAVSAAMLDLERENHEHRATISRLRVDAAKMVTEARQKEEEADKKISDLEMRLRAAQAAVRQMQSVVDSVKNARVTKRNRLLTIRVGGTGDGE